METLFIASAIASAAGATASAVAQYQSNRAMQEAANRNAAIAVRDAGIKKRQYERDAKRQVAIERTQMSTGGLLVDQSSSLDVLADIASQHAERALLIQYEGDVEAARSKQRASAYGSQARSALVGGALSVGGGLLGAGYTGTREFGWGRDAGTGYFGTQWGKMKGMA